MSYYFYTPFNRNIRRMRRFFEDEMPMDERGLLIPVDVKAEADDFIITALVPGSQPEDINIQVINENVTISGELHFENEENADFIHKEIPYGKFQRTIHLPDTLDSSKADATVVNGVLTLRVPKAEEAKPKKIKVNAK